MKTKVFYITGQAYSGSTFLCALLGTHPYLEPISELSKWTTGYIQKPDRLCACGQKAVECSFWVAVENRWLNTAKPDTLQRYVKLQDRFEHISSIWTNNLTRKPRPADDFEEYKDLTVALYKDISDVSKRPTIVDSSKLPGRAMAISKMDELDVSIIHLVRSGIQFLASSLRRGKKISKNDPNLLYETFLLGLNWSATNFSADYVLRMSGCKGLCVRYEDLVSDPIPTVNAMGLSLGFDPSLIKDHIMNNRPVSYGHMSTGSAYRHKGSTPITTDYNAVSEIDWRLKLAFYFGAGPLSRRYGYL